MKLRLKVNGKAVEWEVKPGEFLSETLRARGYDSVKTGCGTGACGLCTVWLDGAPVLSCSTLSLRAEGRELTTLEGVQEEAAAFGSFLVAEGADQCGFCSPGFVMLVLALKRELAASALSPEPREAPSEEEIRDYLVGNLCRCTGYFGRLRAVKAYLESGR